MTTMSSPALYWKFRLMASYWWYPIDGIDWLFSTDSCPLMILTAGFQLISFDWWSLVMVFKWFYSTDDLFGFQLIYFLWRTLIDGFRNGFSSDSFPLMILDLWFSMFISDQVGETYFMAGLCKCRFNLFINIFYFLKTIDYLFLNNKKNIFFCSLTLTQRCANHFLIFPSLTFNFWKINCSIFSSLKSRKWRATIA